MKETVRLVGVLTVICVVAGSLLAWVNGLTAAPIAQAKADEQADALEKVLPEYANDPVADTVTVTVDKKPWVFHVARDAKGAYVGCAFKASSPKGYGGSITVMAGITADGKLSGIEILDQKETPGLGAKITAASFRSGFKNRDILKTKWAVKKDGGDIVEITAATISSRAVTEAVKTGVDVFVKHKQEIAGSQPVSVD